MAAETAQAARLNAPWLSAPETRAMMAALGPGNARFVGGAVRDALLGRPVKDIDIAARLHPDAVILRLERAGLKAVPTGIAHGTVTAVADGVPFEVTTLRRDVEAFGRHARVAFTDDWKADAERRDFTMNALYADPDGTVTDFFGGVGDARAGHVRFIGDAGERIDEDALRILRFFRFHAHYGRGAPDPGGYAACRAKAGNLDILSVERVRDELLKLLAAADPAPVARAMADAGILERVLPEAQGDGGLARLARLVAVERTLGRAERLRRLAALVPAAADTLDRLARRLRLSNADRARLAAMAAPPPGRDLGALKKAAYESGTAAVLDRLLLQAKPDEAAALAPLIGSLERWTPPDFPLAGRDLIAAGAKPGPALGAQLKDLEARWIASGFTLSKSDLLAAAGLKETG